MLDKASGRPRNGSLLAFIKGRDTLAGTPDSPTEDSQSVAKKLRAQLHGTRTSSLFFRFDTWLSGAFPSSVRPWLLTVPSLSTVLLAYGLFSLVVFSGYVSSSISTRFSHTLTSSQDVSSFAALPAEQLMSKVSSLRPILLDPDVLSTPVEALLLSACLWTTDSDVELIPSWAARWTGPMSILVTTTAIPSSSGHVALLAKLAHIQNGHVALKTKLMVHVLHLAPAAELQPNAFLNLARLLSPSPRAVLFPGNLSYAPPKTLYKTLLSQQPSSSSALAPAGHGARKRKPAVLTAKDHMSFPFAPLAPVVIARDDATWCTERFFAGMSRASDWEECLWQVWLANFGAVEVKQIQGWASSSSSDVGDSDGDALDNPAAVKLHRRLGSRFRSETCSLAVRRFAALRDTHSSVDTKKARWLKRVCRSWTSV